MHTNSLHHDPHASPPIPVNVVTGALGVGKTTVIAKLLASKPADEFWVVILNEFTDAGVDAITLASAARGAYDVRLIPGGCLCCTGELDFRRQLRELVNGRRPDRIVIEPSGIGHPGAVLEELRGQERAGVLRLASTIGLVDPQRLVVLSQRDESTERAQLESADVLVLTKLDTATQEDRERFIADASRIYPPKRLLSMGMETLLNGAALAPPAQQFAFAIAPRPAMHSHAHDHAPNVTERSVRNGPLRASAVEHTLLERRACGWVIPREIIFNRVRLHEALLAGADGRLQRVDRLKAVLRSGIEHWTLFNVSPAGVSAEPCGWRQDSRIEVQLRPGETEIWSEWDDFFAASVAQ